MKPSRVESAINNGAVFIRSQQRPDGSFQSFSSPTLSQFKPTITYQTTFTAALILTALSAVDIKATHPIRQKLADWLMAQKSPTWSFNYWATTAPERETLQYPDDLDDTFCALIALRLHNPALIDETCLGNIVKLLVATESQVGGPYRTWLVPKDAPKAWQDIDLAVNSNVAYFLSLVAEPLPNLTELMEKSIVSGNLKSPYYPSIFPIVYYLSRAYKGAYADHLAGHILKHQRGGWWGTPLKTALSISSLAHLGRVESCQTAVKRLVDEQQKDGSWAAEAFCLDPAIQKKKYYNGSAALTTALALEALNAWNSQSKRESPPRKLSVQNQTEDALHAEVLNVASVELAKLKPDLKRKSLTVVENIQKGDHGREIVLLPYLFSGSLQKPANLKHSELIHLGLANLYGWAAYTVYDDFLDGEGRPNLLSVANVAMRYSLKHFERALPLDTAFQELVGQVFDGIDGANSWELAHCRMEITEKGISLFSMPKFSNTLSLADRSLGHAITPMAVLSLSNIDCKNRRAVLVQRALKHYLAARQLHDDLHDWERDLRAGIITFVVSEILKDLDMPAGDHRFDRIIPEMQRQFWHTTLTTVCNIITDHTKSARRAAKSSGLLSESNIITMLTDKIDDSIQTTLLEQSKAIKFLEAYSAPSPKASTR